MSKLIPIEQFKTEVIMERKLKMESILAKMILLGLAIILKGIRR